LPHDQEVRCAWEPSHHTQWKVLHQTKILNILARYGIVLSTSVNQVFKTIRKL